VKCVFSAPAPVRRAVAGLVVFALAVTACTRAEEQVHFFYEAVCASCEASQRMEQLAGRLVAIGRDRPRLAVKTSEIYRADSVEALRRVMDELGVAMEGLRFPILVADGTVYDGEAAVTERIAAFERESAP